MGVTQYYLNIKETVESLLISSNKDTLSTYFHFPQESKTACIQYLVYFAQFLADLGISVDAEIKEEINQTLFKVSPHNKNQSLEQIREALEIYLKIPGEQTFELEISSQTDIAARQFESNVYHLKSQLLLAQSVIQAKDATIEMLQLSNYQYKQHLEIHADKELEKEDVIKGIVAVKKYEGKGFSINLPEILRRLRRKFTK